MLVKTVPIMVASVFKVFENLCQIIYNYDAYYVPMPERDKAKCLRNMHMYTQILNHIIMHIMYLYQKGLWQNAQIICIPACVSKVLVVVHIYSM